MPGLFADGGYRVGMHGLGWLVWLVFLAGFLLLGRGRSGSRGDDPRETPHEMLRRRLANGDITAAGYEERMALLDRDGGRPA